ncbi:MAG: glycosyltransferase family 39 protein [Nanoarchaeota archaeon]|nr:glycosyltransferase family 39 protein [DPANN group archaeon]MBL7117060.1 glycosyltransferase family 39 protein [Nanoarchaeota archaeon]
MKLGIFQDKRFLKKDYVSLIVIFFLVIYFIIQLFGFKGFYSYGWDESVYMHMSDYIQSGGEIGLMETGRPVIFPIILIPFSQSIFLLRLFILVLSIVTLWIFYLIGKKSLDSKLDWLFPALLAVFPFFFITSNSILSEIPTLFFHALCIYFFLNRKYTLSGIFGSVAFLTRFQFGIYLPILFVAIFFFEKKNNWFKHLSRYLLGVFVAIPLLFINVFLFYKETSNFFLAMFYPFISQLTESLVGYAWFYKESVLFYPQHIFTWTFFSVFVLVGFAFLFYNKSKKNIFLAFLLIVSFIYLIAYPQKVVRFLMLCVPWIVYFIAYGLIQTFKNIEFDKKQLFIGLVLIILFANVLTTSYNRINEFHYAPKEFYNEYLFALENKTEAKIIVAFPMIKTKSKIDIGYYKKGLSMYEKLNKEGYDYIFYSDHWFPCQEEDEKCHNFNKILGNYIHNNYDLYINYSLYGSDFLLYSKV